jgi:hypothetical protein
MSSTGPTTSRGDGRVSAASASIVAVLPVIWALFVVLAVGGFLMIAAYWLDVQDRPDLSARGRIGWSAAVIAFPIAIPLYAFVGGPGWPRFLRIASVVPAIAVALFGGFVFGVFD